MTSKRSNGEGTIYKNKSRNRFEGQVSVGINGDGKSVRRKVTGRTRAEVAKKMAEVRDRCSQGPGLPAKQLDMQICQVVAFIKIGIYLLPM